jgi:hypothetical protein
MTEREKLHRLIDELSESDVAEALQYVTWQRADGFTRWLRSLPPGQPDLDSGDTGPEADESRPNARVISFEELRHKHRRR